MALRAARILHPMLAMMFQVNADLNPSGKGIIRKRV